MDPVHPAAPHPLASALFALALLAGSSPNATVTGRVFAMQDTPAAFANVIVLGTRRGAMADESGFFRIEGVPPGDFRLRVQMIGMAQKEIPIHVVAGENDVGSIALTDRRPIPPVRIGNRSAVRAVDIEATIRPAKNRFRVGDAAAFEARIHNHGKRPTLLVQSVDASDAWASPRVTIEIDGPEGGFVVPGLARCGNNNGVGRDDFIEVAPGESFDPYAGGWIGANLVHGRFARPGRYTATFRYSTIDFDPRTWMGGPCIGCDLSPALRDLLAEVPPVDLAARVEFRVDR